MRVLVVENMANSDLGLVGIALAEAGADIDLRRPFAGEALPAAPDAHDAIVVLGGEQSALDDHTHPYLPALATLMRAFGDEEKAVLGICLGSQLLARAHGGKNILGAAREFGWQAISLLPEGRSDPVLAGMEASFPIFEWHSDTFTLPEGAVHLATNGTAANQAFRIGRASYGTQFHFEAGTGVVENWNRIFAEQIEGIDPDWFSQFPERLRRYGKTADAAGLALARAWVAVIGKHDAAGLEPERVSPEPCLQP